MTDTIWLQRPSSDVPWGFRLQGGRDAGTQLTVQRVTGGSIASTGLKVGDVILKIGDTATGSLTQQQAQDLIKNCGNLMQILIAKGGSGGGSEQQPFASSLDEKLHNMNIGGGNTYNSYQPQQQTVSRGPPGAPDFSYNQSPQGFQSPISAGPQGYQSPTSAGPQGFQSPTSAGPQGYHSPSTTGPQGYQSPTSAGPQGYGSPGPVRYQSPGRSAPVPSSPHSAQNNQPPMPDAVLNMASRQGSKDKKPFAYAPDMASIQEQRNKVRKRQPVAAIPHYQNMLNMPSFTDDKPIKIHTPVQPQQQNSENAEDEDQYTCVMAEKYNNPLGLYTEDNVKAALKGQTAGEFSNVSGLPKKDEKDITQSAVYKMIHGLDEPKSKPRSAAPREGYGSQIREPSADDELRFSGVHPPSDIPSKSFQMLQDMTARSEIDHSSIRPPFGGDDQEDGGIGHYDEQSIRYRGRNIPSKSFRMLQSMTGGPQDLPIEPQRRPKKKPQPAPVEQNPDDIVDISYVGGAIPSRSFKILQKSIGETTDDQSGSEKGDIISARTPGAHQVTVEEAKALAAERRRMRRRGQEPDTGGPGAPQANGLHNPPQYTPQRVHQPAPHVAAGQGAPGTPPIRVTQQGTKPAVTVLKLTRKPAPKIKQEEDETDTYGCFDENAYLAGHIAILSGERAPKGPLPTDLNETGRESPEEDTTESRPFDEDAFLTGKLNIMGREEPASIEPIQKEPSPEQAPWVKQSPEHEVSKEFSEQDFLKGRYGLVQSDSQENLLEHVPIAAFSLGPKTKPPAQPKSKPPPHERVKVEKPEFHYDEEQFLAGKVSILGAGDRPIGAPRGKREQSEERPAWSRPDEDMLTDDEFDEDSFLRGRIASSRRPVLKRSASEGMMNRGQNQEQAPWEAAGAQDDGQASDAEFDEDAFLRGRNDFRRTSLDTDLNKCEFQTKAFTFLRRSMSRETTPYTEGSSDRDMEPEEEHDPDKVYNEMVYVGKKIPSKTFARLQRCMDRAKPIATDPLEKLRQQSSIDVDDALEHIEIEKHNPEEYLSKLKETIQQGNENIKIEAEDETTDF